MKYTPPEELTEKQLLEMYQHGTDKQKKLAKALLEKVYGVDSDRSSRDYGDPEADKTNNKQ